MRLLRWLLWLALLAALAAAIAEVRRRLTAPGLVGAPAAEGPHSAEDTPSPTATPAPADDLTAVRGIGPVYRARLAEAGLVSCAALGAADPGVVAAAAGVTEERAADWIAQAAALLAR